MILCHKCDTGLERISQDRTAYASFRVHAVPESDDVAVAAKEAPAVAFSCLLYSHGLFLGWREAAL